MPDGAGPKHRSTSKGTPHASPHWRVSGCIAVPQPAACRAEANLCHVTAVAAGPEHGLETYTAVRGEFQVPPCLCCKATAFPESPAGQGSNCRSESPAPLLLDLVQFQLHRATSYCNLFQRLPSCSSTSQSHDDGLDFAEVHLSNAAMPVNDACLWSFGFGSFCVLPHTLALLPRPASLSLFGHPPARLQHILGAIPGAPMMQRFLPESFDYPCCREHFGHPCAVGRQTP